MLLLFCPALIKDRRFMALPQHKKLAQPAEGSTFG